MAPEPVGLTVASTAGLLSLHSPSVLPLVPSYATFVTGSFTTLAAMPARWTPDFLASRP